MTFKVSSYKLLIPHTKFWVDMSVRYEYYPYTRYQWPWTLGHLYGPWKFLWCRWRRCYCRILRIFLEIIHRTSKSPCFAEYGKIGCRICDFWKCNFCLNQIKSAHQNFDGSIHTEFDQTYPRNAQSTMSMLVSYIKQQEKMALHSWIQSIFTLMVFSHASGMLQVVLGWTQVLHSWPQVHLVQLQLAAQSSYIMGQVIDNWLGAAICAT